MRVVVAAEPAAKALLQYAYAEALSLIRANIDIVNALVEALVVSGMLSGAEVDEIISRAVVARARAAERQRRDDWRQRERNAAEFLRVIETADEPGY